MDGGSQKNSLNCFIGGRPFETAFLRVYLYTDFLIYGRTLIWRIGDDPTQFHLFEMQCWSTTKSGRKRYDKLVKIISSQPVFNVKHDRLRARSQLPVRGDQLVKNRLTFFVTMNRLPSSPALLRVFASRCQPLVWPGSRVRISNQVQHASNLLLSHCNHRRSEKWYITGPGKINNQLIDRQTRRSVNFKISTMLLMILTIDCQRTTKSMMMTMKSRRMKTMSHKRFLGNLCGDEGSPNEPAAF
jgi:hypothetical protein